MREVVIVSAARTPIGSFGGALKGVPTRKLGAIAIKGAVERAGIKPEMVDEVIMGAVLQGALGQNVARQMTLDAGLPIEVPAMTINKVCGSGLRAVELAAQIIKAGDADIIVAGGAENMSATAYAMPSARWGARMNNAQMVDMMVNDGLWDAFNGYHMGITAENVAEQWGLTREQLDARILREFEAGPNKQFKNVIGVLFPSSLTPVMLELGGIPAEKKIHDISREERQHFIDLIKAFPFTITGMGEFKEAIITRGGVSVKEINPGTMESKKISGLYFAGEVLDLDAVTGGYNLQIAWSTAYLAAQAIQ